MTADAQRAKHGTRTGYVYWYCRCAECRRATADYQANLNQRLKARGAADPALIPHGTHGGYTNWGCRCPECKDVYNADQRRRRAARRVSP